MSRWGKRSAIGSLLGLVLAALVLVVVNAIDYAPYGLALRRVHKLNSKELIALAAACARYEKGGHQRLLNGEIPPEFHALKPVRVSIYPGSSDISLLEHGYNRYVFLRVSTSPVNQEITLVSCCGSRQLSQTLWEKDPELTRRLQPSGRILTIAEWKMHSTREWIVLPTRLLVVDRRSYVGGSDQIACEVPLNAEQRTLIENKILCLGAEVRGQAFDAGASDGIGLRVSFSPDGKPNQGTDIVLQNAWREELAPLVQAVSQVTDKEHRITFPDEIKRMDILQGRPPTIMSLKEYDRVRSGIRLPWWSWWPRMMDNTD